ncbi:hypothetical protein P7M32_01955 [Bisgaard Taxon 10/6]|uniref:Uncharacterized protein n=1 Tax=Exercitatus varius TaxID=67857 RepID=A0ABT6EP97_9PAST|nr:hypothetical protein [Exercitatus varius]MDG2939234.1 hypothetical protein [Exercitatus varius]MDG2945200.1 hypothetical protein [Exercitatus varius]
MNFDFDEKIKKRPIYWLGVCCTGAIAATFIFTDRMLSDTNESLNERIKIFEKSELDLKEEIKNLQDKNKDLNEVLAQTRKQLSKIQNDHVKLELDYKRLKDQKPTLIKNPPKSEQENRILDIKARIRELKNQKNNCSIEKINGGDFMACQQINKDIEDRIDQYYNLLNSIN